MKRFVSVLVITLSFSWSFALDEDDTQVLDPQTPSKESKELIDDATKAAAREVGRVIGRRIGHDMYYKMTPDDQKALLDRERAALRGALLFQYAFQGSPYRNQLHGYIIVTREGHDAQGRLCRELEMDLILDMQRHFERSVACLSETEEWLPVNSDQVSFPPRGPRGPSLPPGGAGRGGGWLPPLNP